jgi:hypothetical protein
VTILAGLIWLSVGATTLPDPTEPPPKIELALRAAYAFPFGSVGRSTIEGPIKLGDVTDGSLPLTIEGDYRLSSLFSTRLLLQYALVDLRSNPTENCSVNVSCSGRDFNVVAEGVFRPFHWHRLDPWLGLGAGYEWFSSSISSAFGGESFSTNGPMVLAEVGAGYRATARLTIGPYVAAFVGRFSRWNGSEWTTAARDEFSGEFSSPTLHEWIHLGLRVSLSVD